MKRSNPPPSADAPATAALPEVPSAVPSAIVAATSDSLPRQANALARARASGLPSVLHCLIDPEAITPTGTLQGIRAAALAE